MEDHYPGDMTIKVTHTYDADHRWTIQYEAESTKRTLFNPTNHVYFNLNRDNNVVDNHRMSSSSLKMYTLDDENIVTGDEPLNFAKYLKMNTFSLKIYLIVRIKSFKNKCNVIKV